VWRRSEQRYAVLRDERFNAVNDPKVQQLSRIDVEDNRRSRRILTGDVIYHFGKGHAVRPFLGGGLGIMSNHVMQTCSPAGCELLMPLLSSPVGQLVSRSGNLAIIGGASALIMSTLRIRGGIRLHNLAGEGLSTTEVFAETDYRFHFR
jgi:hypothetical protein